MDEELIRQEYHLRFAFSIDDLESARRRPLLSRAHVDGLILLANIGSFEEAVGGTIDPTRTVIVSCPDNQGRWKEKLPADIIAIEKRRAIYRLVEHLVALGHRRLGFLGASPTTDERAEAFIHALARHDLPFALLLLTRRVKAKKVYQEIDGPLLIMFAGLFVLIAGVERNVLTPEVVANVERLHLENAAILSAFTAVLSNLVSNVPAVLALKPFVAPLDDPQRAWLVIAMASTLAGNFTLLGSVANLIVVQRAAAEGIEVNFWSYFRIGAPMTLATIVVGVLLL